MELLYGVLNGILPLYILIACGFFSARLLKIDGAMVADLAVYIFLPAVVFLGTAEAGGEGKMLLLVLYYLIFGALLSGISYFLGKKLWNDGSENIFAFASGTGNTGYFGIPLALAVFGQESLSSAVLIALGTTLYANTLGYYLFARARYSIRDALYRLLTFPSLYAFILGVFAGAFQAEVPSILHEALDLLKGAYTPLGMMIIGLGLAGLRFHHVDNVFVALNLLFTFVLWFFVALFVIHLDVRFFHLFDELVYKVLVLQSIVPLAANTVVFAVQFKVHPEKAAATVFISTLCAVLVIPLVLFLLPSLLRVF